MTRPTPTTSPRNSVSRCDGRAAWSIAQRARATRSLMARVPSSTRSSIGFDPRPAGSVDRHRRRARAPSPGGGARRGRGARSARCPPRRAVRGQGQHRRCRRADHRRVPGVRLRPDATRRRGRRLLDAGAIFVGKTNLDQFATGLVGTRSPQYGICRESRSTPSTSPGGSSSGSAVAVALGLVPFALGTDTAGSGRVPAAFCGVVGLKPTPRTGEHRGRRACVAVVRQRVGVRRLERRRRCRLRRAVGAELVEPAEPTAPARWRIGVPRTLAWFGDDDARRRSTTRSSIGWTTLGTELRDIDLSPFLEAGALLYGSALVAERCASFGQFVLANPGSVDSSVQALVLDAPRHDAPSVFRRAARARAVAHVDGGRVEERRCTPGPDHRAPPDDRAGAERTDRDRAAISAPTPTS